ncbi:MAG: AMP-binding protein [[Eubacterium] sulci]|nr:AMP-binding protein [[Eubacterium] sulci]
MMNKRKLRLEQKFHRFENLRELLKTSAEKYADRVAYVTKVRGSNKEVSYINTTYKMLLDEMNYLGSALWELGYNNSRLAVLGDNSYHWCLSYFATACGLGVVVPLDKMLQKDELIGLLQRSECTAIFCDKKSYKTVKEIMDEGNTSLKVAIGMDFAPEGGLCIHDLLDRGKELVESGYTEYTEAPIDPEAMSFLLFTSGTTSASKAVMLSHSNIMSVNYSMNLEEEFFPDDVNLMILPLHHIYGMMGMITFISQGMKNAFFDGLKYILINMKEYEVSVLMTVPLLLENMYRKIIKAAEKQGMGGKIEKALKICAISEKFGINIRRKVFKSIIDQLGGKIRFIINGAAALDPVVAKGMNDFGILTVQGYGLTETAPTIASESQFNIRHGSVGKLMPFVEGRIDNPDENGIGELVVRGENVMLGYYNDEAATKEVIVDGWFHTGDLARFDEDDFLWLMGRKKNVIVMKNGKNVFPEEIENLVGLLPYVDECMLFSRNRQNDVVLWMKVVYNKEYLSENNLTVEQLEKQFDKDLDMINESMPAYKMVKRFFLSDRPTIKTTTQKTKRPLELEQIEKELSERGIQA